MFRPSRLEARNRRIVRRSLRQYERHRRMLDQVAVLVAPLTPQQRNALSVSVLRVLRDAESWTSRRAGRLVTTADVLVALARRGGHARFALHAFGVRSRALRPVAREASCELEAQSPCGPRDLVTASEELLTALRSADAWIRNRGFHTVSVTPDLLLKVMMREPACSARRTLMMLGIDVVQLERELWPDLEAGQGTPTLCAYGRQRDRTLVGRWRAWRGRRMLERMFRTQAPCGDLHALCFALATQALLREGRTFVVDRETLDEWLADKPEFPHGRARDRLWQDLMAWLGVGLSVGHVIGNTPITNAPGLFVRGVVQVSAACDAVLIRVEERRFWQSESTSTVAEC